MVVLKAHKARVAKRNERLKVKKEKLAEKQYVSNDGNNVYKSFKAKFSGLTENDELNAENIVEALTVEEPTQEDTKPVEDQVSELEK